MFDGRLPTPQGEKYTTGHKLLEQKMQTLHPSGQSLLGELADHSFRISAETRFSPPPANRSVVLGTTSMLHTREQYNRFCQKIEGTSWREAYLEAFPQARIRGTSEEILLSHAWTMEFVKGLLEDPQTHVVFYVVPEIFGDPIEGQDRIAQRELDLLLSAAKESTPERKRQLLEKVDIVLGF